MPLSWLVRSSSAQLRLGPVGQPNLVTKSRRSRIYPRRAPASTCKAAIFPPTKSHTLTKFRTALPPSQASRRALLILSLLCSPGRSLRCRELRLTLRLLLGPPRSPNHSSCWRRSSDLARKCKPSFASWRAVSPGGLWSALLFARPELLKCLARDYEPFFILQ